MTLKTIYASLAIAALLFLIGILLIRAPVKVTAECKDFDGLCPSSCSFAEDIDCPKQQLVQPGALFSCMKDEDCIVADAICSNEDCVYFDEKCRYGNRCYVSISKTYGNVWSPKDVECSGTEPQLNCTNKTALSPRCSNGVCQV